MRDMVPWAGEFAGKYLTGAVQVLRLTGNVELKAVLADFVADLVACQAEDGYLGPWPHGSQLTGDAPNCKVTWDAWGHYHVMMGLMLWAEHADDEKALRERIISLAKEYGRYGYRRITALLRNEGWQVNDKRVERIWREEGLKVPQKQRKRGRLWLNDGSCVRLRPEYPNHV